ncbi:MAG: hypothetical protein IJL85_03150 [Erysipelotrichaceae bacterium]|nr:hypothetical protein [Erysipelotrichaceae bacterium]
MDEKKKQRNRKLAAGLIAGVTSASVLLGRTFDSPKDLLDDLLNDTDPVVEECKEVLLEERHPWLGMSFRQTTRKYILKIPVKLRMVLCVPLWIMGNALLFMANLLVRTILTPLGHLVLGFLLQTLILMAIIAICIKILFPDLLWSKIFNKKTVLSVIIGSIIMSICDAVMPLFWDQYKAYRRLSKLILGSVVILLIMKPFLQKKWKERVTYDIQYDFI